jgi:hypothetical protein
MVTGIDHIDGPVDALEMAVKLRSANSRRTARAIP